MNMRIWLKPKINQAGLGLVEILVALVIGLVMSLAVTHLHISNRQLYSTTEDMSRLQESMRFSANIMNNEIRMAGYMGCVNVQSQSLTSTIAAPDYTNNFINALEGYEAKGTSPNDAIDLKIDNVLLSSKAALSSAPSQSWSPALPIFVSGATGPQGPQGEEIRALPSSDIIIVRHAETSSFATVTENIPNGFTAPDIGNIININNFTVNDALYISDCDRAVVFQPNTVTTNTVTYNVLGSNFSRGSEIMLAKSVMLFIARNDISDEPILYQRINNQMPIALAEGIENLQILYGIDTDNDNIVNVYLPADATDFSNSSVIAVRLGFIVRAQGQNNPQGNTIQTFNDIAQTSVITPSDQRIRQFISLTVAIRNV